MKKLFNLRRIRGAAGSQYALIVGLIAVIAIIAITNVGSNVTILMSRTANTLTFAANSTSASTAPSGGNQPFTPASISGLVAWYDPSSTASLSLDGSNGISAMADLSGAGHSLAQATTTRRPVAGVTAGFSSRQAMTLSQGSAQYLSTSNVPLAAGDSTFTMVAVFRVTGGGYAQDVVEQDLNVGTTCTYRNSILVTNSAYGYCGECNDTQNSLVPFSVNTKYRAIMRVNGTSIRMFSNGTEYSASVPSVPNTGAEFFGIGAKANNSEYFNGQIGEVIVYNRVITDAERDQLDSYLAGRW